MMGQMAKRNAEVEKVCKAFEDYIKSSPYIDWIWSDKLGYILMQISLERGEIMESRVISDAGKLCLILLNEIADDVLQMTGNDHTSYEADPPEREEIKKRLEPYMERLPEYRYLYEELFKA